MKMRNYLAGLAITATLFSCNNNSTELVIEGSVIGAKEFIVYENKPQQYNPIDTIKLEDGEFKIGLELDTPGFYWFVFDDAGASIPMYLRPHEKIEININLEGNYPEYTVEGSDGSSKMQAQWISFYKTYIVSDSLDQISRAFSDNGQEIPQELKMQLDQTFQKRLEAQQNEVKAIIEEDFGDVTNIMGINQRLGQMPLFDFPTFFKLYRSIDEKLFELYPEDENVVAFHMQMQEYNARLAQEQQLSNSAQNTNIGDPAPNIALQDPDGQIRELDNLKGKVVLLDFWASWCRPCRINNPGLVAAYNKYKNRGFDVFSVSLDGLPKQKAAKKEWVAAIAKDHLTWENHVSDLMGWNTPMVQLYRFNGIPHTVLIDRNGIIIAKNLHGAALDAKIEELL